ncbi:MAG TPA: D-2-hydroxyacid dehydrogenase [Candidatus Limnocylindria bacterium]|nr:D-2-hydroxyacid dehydrogenase [Candidatus Limnocylindria bacterium]
MPPPSVLEFVRSRDAVWNLPPRFVAELAREFPEVRFIAPADQAEADERLAEADVVFGWAVTRDNFSAAKRLRWIHLSAAGVGSQLFPALVESDVVLTNGRGLHGVAMAEHTLGVLLAFTRKLHLARDAQRARRWAQRALWSEPPPYGALAGTTMGLVGFGAVGRAIAERATALGIDVLAVRRHPDPDPRPAVAQWDPSRMPDVLARADWLVLAVPLTNETRRLMDADALAQVKSGAILVNLGRGGLVDEAALVAALRDGRLAGAALDVFEREPLPEASPLWEMPQVIVTPHVSGFGPRYWERSTDQFRRNLRAFLDGAPLENVVDKRAGY